MSHAREPLRLDDLRPGYYRLRRVRNGPWIAARIEIADGMISVTEEETPVGEPVALADLPDLVVTATIDGEAFRHPLLRLVYFGVPIEEPEYRHLLAVSQWAARHAPQHPSANPDRTIDLHTTPIRYIV